MASCCHLVHHSAETPILTHFLGHSYHPARFKAGGRDPPAQHRPLGIDTSYYIIPFRDGRTLLAIRKTFKWICIILLVLGGSAGGYLYWLYTHSDDILREMLLKYAHEKYPNVEINIERARFDWNRRIHVFNVTMQLPGESQPVVRLPEVVVVADRNALQHEHSLVIQKVHVSDPQFHFIRDANGLWNYLQLTPESDGSTPGSLPEWTMDGAHGTVQLRREDRTKPTELVFEEGQLKLVPSGRRRFLIDGSCEANKSGRMRWKGEWDLEAGAWTITGQIQDVEIDRQLVQMVGGAVPKIETAMIQADERLVALTNPGPSQTPGLPGATSGDLLASRQPPPRSSAPANGVEQVSRDGNGVPIRTAAVTNEIEQPNSEPIKASPIGHSTSPAPPRPPEIPDFGLAGEFDFSFQLWKNSDQEDVDFKYLVSMRHVHAVHEALPLAVNDLSGQLYLDGNQFILRDFRGRHGASAIDLSGRMANSPDGLPDQFDVSIKRLALDERLKERLPPSLQELFHKFQPRGHVDVEGTLVRADDEWVPQNFVVSFTDARATYDRFRYPLRAMQGKMIQQGTSRDIAINCTALAGQWPVVVDCHIKNAGPAAEVHMEVSARQFGVDETLLSACPPAGRKVLEAMHVQGVASAKLELQRPPGFNQRIDSKLTVKLAKCSMQPDVFPYRFANMTGTIVFIPQTQTWTFSDIKSQSDEGYFEASGSMKKQFDPASRSLKPAMDLEIFVHRASLDQIKPAVPDSLESAWNQVDPSGQLTALSNIHWMAGYPTQFSVRAAEISNGSVRLKSFPYPLEGVNAKFSYANGVVDLKSFQGHHDDTQIRGAGSVKFWPNGQWQILIKDLFADDLIPDRLFRRSLNESMRAGLEAVNPRGPVSLEMRELVLTGHEDPRIPTTVSWDYKAVLYGTAINAGLDLEAIHGFVSAKGTWDGKRVDNHGEINFDSVNMLGYQVKNVSGPYHIIDSQLVIGAESILSGKGAREGERRVTGDAINGKVTFDAICLLGDEPEYRVISTINGAELGEYARLYLPGQTKLRGKIRGWIDLKGRGKSAQGLTGRGRLEIRDGQIYELPVIGQVLKVLSFTAPDKTAFNQVLVDFDVEREAFRFNMIDLIGDALSLRGKGWARFDKKLHLDFYSMLSRTGRSIPLVNALVGEATKGWVGVEVRGTVNSATAQLKAIPQLDDAMRRFLGNFNPTGLIPSIQPSARRSVPTQTSGTSPPFRRPAPTSPRRAPQRFATQPR